MAFARSGLLAAWGSLPYWGFERQFAHIEWDLSDDLGVDLMIP
jgi:hypothetical protein